MSPDFERVMIVSRTPEHRLAIVIPMYNERAGAEQCVRRVLAVLSSLEISAGLIVVDDGSRDGTGPILDDLQRTAGGFKVVHKPNGGYGSAITFGAHEATADGYDYVLFMDSDLTNPPEHVARFVPAILLGIDLIKGSRFSHGGDAQAVPWRRRIFSIVGNIVARALFRMGLSDCTNGFRAIRTELYLKMPLKESGFAVIMEELYWAKRWGATVTTVPTSLSSRSTELRPTLFAYRPRVIWSYLKHALRASLRSYRPRQGGYLKQISSNPMV